MIKLKNLLSEFDITKSRHMSTDSSFSMLLRMASNVLHTSINRPELYNVLSGETNTLDVRKFIKDSRIKTTEIPVPGHSNLIVYRCAGVDDDQADYYIMFNTDLDARHCFIGLIKTNPIKSAFGYSPKSTFKINGTVRRIHLSELGKEHIGKGYGSLLYQAVWNDSAALASDWILFKGSFAMGTNKILKDASLFGMVLGEDIESSYATKVIIPLNSPKEAQSISVTKSGRNFIAFKGEVPAPVRKVAHNLEGIDIAKELIVYKLDHNISEAYEVDPDSLSQEVSDMEKNKSWKLDIFEVLDYCDNLQDLNRIILEEDTTFFNRIAFGTNAKNKRVAILLFKDATLIVKQLKTGTLANVLV